MRKGFFTYQWCQRWLLMLAEGVRADVCGRVGFCGASLRSLVPLASHPTLSCTPLGAKLEQQPLPRSPPPSPAQANAAVGSAPGDAQSWGWRARQGGGQSHGEGQTVVFFSLR